MTAAAPVAAAALLRRGESLLAAGDASAAATAFEQAFGLAPRRADIAFACGSAHRRAGNLAAACRHFAHAALLDPKDPRAPFEVGVILRALGRPEQALQALDEALKSRPAFPAALYEQGQILNDLQRYDDADARLARAIALDPRAPAPRLGLARTRHLQGRCAEARALIAQALAAGAPVAQAQTALGQVWQTEGDFAAAAAAFRAAIVADPTATQAHLCLALIDRDGDPRGRAATLRALAGRSDLDAEQRATLGYALGAALEACGETDAAFAAYRDANRIRRTQLPYDPTGLPAAAQRIEAAFDAPLFSRCAGFGEPSPRPVFVVGMMRSGTSLVEQILASHPAVHGHGELVHLGRIAASLPPAAGGAAWPDTARALDFETAHRSARSYLGVLEREAPAALRSIDKAPHNFERLGLAALLLPGARVIHCTRDPVDTCLSNYFHDFGAQHPQSCDLRSLGLFHRYAERLMAHWRRVLPLPMLEVPYEALVADTATWSRRMVDFLGLPWDDACLDFHRNTRPVHTYSLWQVRQPVFATSVQRWRPYAAHLGELFDALGTPDTAGA